MKVLVCGSREFMDRKLIWATLDALLELHGDDLIVIQGGASGADTFARIWAVNHEVPTYHFPARWAKYGKKAGMMRNREMLERTSPDVVLAFPLPTDDPKKNRGTRGMMTICQNSGYKVIDITEIEAKNQQQKEAQT